MVTSKFTEHLDGHILLTYNSKSVSLEDILREVDSRAGSFETPSPSSSTMEYNSFPETSTSSSALATEEASAILEMKSAARAETDHVTSSEGDIERITKRRGNGRRWTNPFGKSGKA
jgi:hypothetical protein